MEVNDTFNGTSSPNCGLDPHDFLEVKFILISIIGTLIGCFGIFGNISTAIILTRPSMRNPNNLFLTALAVFDTCLLVTAFFIYGMEYIIEYTAAFDLYVAWLTYLRFAFAISHISQTGSVYITVTVTIERYLAVCYPRRNKRYCTSHGSAITILGVTCFAIIFNCTKFFELEVIRNPECGDGVSWQSYVLMPSKLAQNPVYGQMYALWLTNIVMVFLPFLTLLILNSIIAYTIKKSLNKLSGESISGRNELKEKSREATLVLITIVFIFLICNFWGFVLTLLEQIMDNELLMVQYHMFYTFSREAINLLAIVNSSINFVIYLIFGKDFRKELVIVYGCGTFGLTIRLPAQDKFQYWRQFSRRRLSRNMSPRITNSPIFANGMRFLRKSSDSITKTSNSNSIHAPPSPGNSICCDHIVLNGHANHVKANYGHGERVTGYLTPDYKPQSPRTSIEEDRQSMQSLILI
ncbi:hypothetical protein QR680_000842 [Steinernema hermaphroditum]|uniref:G-protein coupled receptors family 1 profile domain-containing protein n=1 Tax=Steinernema hermaphroditum TaxID=289476 RepID=A0AA39LF06_9BILA|nr:hypothetical protein QR680_000842 [Steinernema hermaphroditum]